MLEQSFEVNPAIASRIGRPRSVLELGCGAGVHGALSRKAGARVVGVEAEPELAARAGRVLDQVLPIDPLDLAAVERALQGQRFELVLIPTALQRAEEPARLVALAASLLAPEGRLLYAAHDAQARAFAQQAGLTELELGAAPTLAPARFAERRVVVARRPPLPGPLSLTVGMLTMDEEPSVARMIEQIRKYAPAARILCVDSSQRDRTPQIAERLGARVLRQLPPRGHGPAMELLMYEAARESDALVYLDCDFTYPPEDIPKLVRILESGADVVNAARIRSRPESMPLANYLANKTFAWCAQAMNGAKVSDLHSGMRGYRASLIRSFAFDGSGDALPIDTLLWPLRSGYRVVEIPMQYQERVGISKLRRVAGTVWTFIRLARTLRVGSRRSGAYEIWDSAEGPGAP